MINNDILRRLRYALDIKDPVMIAIFKADGLEMRKDALLDLLKKETDPSYVKCSDQVLASFLNGLIIHKRGPKENSPAQENKPAQSLTNNLIMKKLRIALELKEEDILGMLKLAEINVSASELTALFRREGHKHFKECGDQFLRNFIKGLTLHYRRS